MNKIFKNFKIILLVLLLIVSITSITLNGIEFGVEFKGGTLFQIQLDEKADSDRMEIIVSIISQRLDAFGLKDTKVNSLGDDFVLAQIAETDPRQIEQLESLIKTQGKFEAILDGEVLFDGSDIVNVFKDATSGYGVFDGGNGGGISWNLPFLLNQNAAQNFSRGVFHRCTAIGFDPQAGTQYDCDDTYFFIDRPSDSVVIVPESVIASDSELLFAGNIGENIPQGTSFNDLVLNSGLSVITVDSDQNFSSLERQELELLIGTKKKAIVHELNSMEQRAVLTALGYKVIEVRSPEFIPWIWTATGARQVIALTPGITNLQPMVDDVRNATIFSQLNITGGSISFEEGTAELKSLEILLETGSLPIGIRSISKEIISPLLGEEFLQSALLIGIVGLFIVTLVLFIRYRRLELTFPIALIGVSEIIIILGFASLIKFNLDLAAVAGILAVVGTGVDHQIIITDELLRGELITGGNYVNRIKRAFFIIFAAASTTIATMLPIIVFGFGFGKLVGFAITIVLGVLVGIFVTRPAFSVMAEFLLRRADEKSEES